ncbi:hypothetical protein C8J57DRAFT_1522020 [Mycena rebaudengoi]|nr:hypothetical protein C8J57DRAFT_1522020 [Mycena rebaudengoi]
MSAVRTPPHDLSILSGMHIDILHLHPIHLIHLSRTSSDFRLTEDCDSWSQEIYISIPFDVVYPIDVIPSLVLVPSLTPRACSFIHSPVALLITHPPSCLFARLPSSLLARSRTPPHSITKRLIAACHARVDDTEGS